MSAVYSALQRFEQRRAAGEPQGARLDADEIDRAEQRVLCDVDTFCDEIGAEAMRAGSGDCLDTADRMLRVDSRAHEFELHVVLAGVLLAAHRGDDDATVANAARALAARYLKAQGEYVQRVAGGAL